jgi:hypothetical protein
MSDTELEEEFAEGVGEYGEGQTDESLEAQEQEAVSKSPKKPKTPKKKQAPAKTQAIRRFGAIHNPESLTVRDLETREVIMDGFSDVGTAMFAAEVLERLERIENLIGSFEK